MNNDAFQKLVHERSNIKSSKEIAREAVEQEFRKNRGRQRQRRGGGGGSDDDASSGEEEGGGNRRPKRPLNNKQSKNQDDDDDKPKDADTSAYRDRAKERREMQNADAQVRTKGLDLTLARSVKQQASRLQDNNDKYTGKAEDIAASFVQNRQEALHFISSSSSTTIEGTPIQSELGKEMLEYLRATFLKDSATDNKKMISVTPAGYAIQQSTLTFSIHANPGDTPRAWEVPREQTYGVSIDDCHRLYTKASPCNNVIILENMETVLQRNNKKNTSTRSGRPQTKPAAIDKSKQSQQNSNDDDSDDDDIFGNVGEYDPISDMNHSGADRQHHHADKNDEDNNDDSNNARRPKVDKGSLFEQEDNSKGDHDEAFQKKNGAIASAFTSVDDEELDFREGNDTAAASASMSSRLVGFSSLSYNAADGGGGVSGYGDDEMDVDFDGRIQDEEEEEGNKKNKKKRKRKNKGGASDED